MHEESKMHAEKCPVCYGNGSIKKDNSPCHGCSGKGWILVPNDKDTTTIPLQVLIYR